ALRRGRFYAVEQEAGAELALTEFSVRAGAAAGVSGDLMQTSESAVEITLAVEASGAAPREGRVMLVRNGAVVKAWPGPAPSRAVHGETFAGSPTFYRLEVRGPGRLVSNPIFLRRS